MPNDNTLHHPDQPRFLFSTWVWAVALFLCFGAIVAITFGAMKRDSNYETDRAKIRSEKRKTAEEDWNKTAHSYGWIDKAKGVAHVPIARAMELELTDLQARPPTAAGPIATPAPAAVPVTDTGAGQPANPSVTAPPDASTTPKATTAEGNTSEGHNQPAGAANPPNAPAGTQPGAAAPPAAQPQSLGAVAPVSPTATPVLTAPGTPLPVRGNGETLPPSPQPQP